MLRDQCAGFRVFGGMVTSYSEQNTTLLEVLLV